MKPVHKTLAFWVFLGLLVVLVVTLLTGGSRSVPDRIEFSQVMTEVRNGQVTEITFSGNEIYGKLKDGRQFKSYGPGYSDYYLGELEKKGVIPNFKQERESPLWSALAPWLPIVFMLVMLVFFMRQIQVGGGKAMNFGRSKAKLQTDQHKKVTFTDVAGVDEAKEELKEIIDFLKDPRKFQRLGGRIPKGVLLMGSPGSGKTLLARAIAGEAGVPFFSISGSDFVEMFVGVGASRVRDLFEQGKKYAPCIIFIDEIDAVGRNRGHGIGGGNDEREQTLNQLLVEMDGFESNEGVILVAATNRPDVLDPALLRPGRFDRRVVVPRPDVKGREGILEVHSRRTPIARNVDLKVLARATPGFSGADLESLVNEAALMAARADKKEVDMSDLEAAKDKVLMGSERRSMIISDDEKRSTAFHEAGHALVAKLTPGADPLHKVTIIPRGMALGVTQQLPMDEKHTYSRDDLLNKIAILMGGRIAEELALNLVSNGAGNDIERATEMARKMVCEWGMSEKLGPLAYTKQQENPFLGRDFSGSSSSHSEQTSRQIDEEIHRIVTDCYGRARLLIQANMHILQDIANQLLEKESLDGEEVNQIIHRHQPVMT
ncbi:MAG: ATP-dependent zinc metalloprotease FtsH [Myxococcota bacterium]